MLGLTARGHNEACRARIVQKMSEDPELSVRPVEADHRALVSGASEAGVSTHAAAVTSQAAPSTAAVQVPAAARTYV